MRTKLIRLTVALPAAVLLLAAAAPALADGWFRTPVPATAQTQRSVSCWSSSGCLSVGDTAMRWNGTAWTTISKPAGTLESVACTSGTFCLAAGQNSTGRAATWKWNGAGWKALTTYNPASAANILYAVKCASASSCEAVGAHGGWPLAEHWNGTSWSGQSTYGAPHGALYGVSCESSSACEAVGANADGTTCSDRFTCPVAPIAMAMGWKVGSKWSVQATPLQPFLYWNTQDGPGSSNWQDTAVSCWSSGCMAVGWQFQSGDPSSTNDAAYAEKWNGKSWSVSQYGIDCGTNNICAQSGGSALSAVHCSSASACTAAGLACDQEGCTEQTAIVTWNGTTWNPVTSPTLPSADTWLNGLSCGKVCVAVGSSNQSSPEPAYAIRS